VVPINLPPLRDRLEDLPLLCESFLRNDIRSSIKTISEGVYSRLRKYDWPGNVRELYNVLLRSALLGKGETLEAEDLIFPDDAGKDEPGDAKPVRRRKRVSTHKMLEAIKGSDGNIQWAAEKLGIARFTIYRMLKKAGIDMAQFK